MIECMKKWEGIEWDGESEIQEYIFGEAVKGLKFINATALYLATFMKRTEMVRSLIKYSGEEYIKSCFRSLNLTDEIEEVFMLDQAEKLKKKHSDLRPTVIPGHRVEKGGNRIRTFIVYSIHVIKASSYELDGDLGLVMVRNPYIYSREGEGNTDRKKTVSYEDAKRAAKAVSIHRENLWKNHSNLNIISVNRFKYQNNGADIIEKTCIELYCSTKGVVPLGDPEFPKRLDIGEHDYIDVDVHEGYFKYGMYQTSPTTHHHATLKMGCRIGRSTPEYDARGNLLDYIGGTLGPFVKFDGKIGFLTCAHVLFNITNAMQPVHYQHSVGNEIDVVQPSVDITVTGSAPCGHVHKAIFNPQLTPSVDVAVVELTNRIPQTGQFAVTSWNTLNDAGFDQNRPPEYNNGLIQSDIGQLGTSQIVVKFGSFSDVTRGVLDVSGVDVRPLSTVLGLPRNAGNVHMTGQYQVFGAYPTLHFFAAGDSGSAVFMINPDTRELVCIGMAIGHTNVNVDTFPSTVVTPIGAILNALGPRYSIASFL